MAFLARTLNPSSIGNYLNAIRILHLDQNLPNPLADNFALKNLKTGINREKGTPPKQALPITRDMLLKIFKLLSPGSSADIAFWAACLVGFYGFLRKATLLPVRMVDPGDDCLLRYDVTKPSSDMYLIFVRKTKTIQFGERILRIPFVASTTGSLCPVRALNNLMIVGSRKISDPLFSYRCGNQVRWWTHESFTKKLRTLLFRAGYNSKRYTGHSFRRGGATYGFQRGLTMEQVKQRGDWASAAVNNYVYFSLDEINKIASVLVNGY